MARRFELTFPEPLWEQVEQARGRESRASFVKRAVEAALSGGTTFTSRPVERAPSGSAVGTARPAAPPRASARALPLTLGHRVDCDCSRCTEKRDRPEG